MSKRLLGALMLAGCLLWAPVATSHAKPKKFRNQPAGAVVTPLGRTAEATATLIQPDGRIVAGGNAVARHGEGDRFALARYLNSGRLDPSFARFPRVKGPKGGLEEIALAPDGRIIAAGRHAGNFVVARYLPDGHLDRGFGAGTGFVETDFGGWDFVAAVDALPDGRIVVAGDATLPLPDGSDASKFVVARYAPDGALDPSYGVGGRATAELMGGVFAEAARVTDDGTVTVAGDHYVGIDQDAAGIALARFSPSGLPDPAFGAGGVWIAPFPPAPGFQQIILRGMGFLPDGRVVAAGETLSRVVLEALLPDGTLDPAFGIGGVAIFRGTAGLTYIAEPDPTGAVYRVEPTFGPLRGTYGHAQGLGITKYSPTGGVDRSFGRRGRSRIPFDDAEALTVQTDTFGRILIAGFVSKVGAGSKFLLLRLRPGGGPDRSFGRRHRSRHRNGG